MKTLLLALVAACGLALSCSEAWAWQTNISGTAVGTDWAIAVAVDGAGNVVAVGRTFNSDTGGDFTVVKHDGASGAELWRQVINGSANWIDEARAVTVDGAGDVVAVGFMYNIGTGFDFMVVKFDGASGAELWRQVISGAADGSDEARAVAVDGAGNVIAAGVIHKTGTLHDFSVVKFDGASGAELWRQVIDGTANASDEAYYSRSEVDGARAVALDWAGNVIAAGVTNNTGTGSDFTVAKFDGTSGAELWRQAINGSANRLDQANAVAVDGAGNVVAAGTLIRSINKTNWLLNHVRDFTVVKFEGGTGVELWRRTTDVSMVSGGGEAVAVTVDGSGDVVAAGFEQNLNVACPGFNGQDFMVVKVNGASGVDLWRQVFRGSAAGLCHRNKALAVTVDGGGDVIATGYTAETWSEPSRDFAVVKFQGTHGVELWRRVINGSANGWDEARAVAVDGVGNVVAAGISYNTDTAADFTVVKLRGTDGGDF